MAITIPRDEMKQQVGRELGPSEWLTIDQDRISLFADATNDHQFIHVDVEKAKHTPFGGTIAHGFLTLSLMSAMTYEAGPQLKGVAMGLNYGMDKMRFLAPVPAGSRVRGRFTLMKLDESKPGEVTYTNAVTVEIEGSDKPAIYAEWIGRAYFGA